MNKQFQNHRGHHWLGWIALLAFASVLSPINIRIVIAQEAPEIVVAPADAGQPPAPPQSPASPEVPTEVPAEAAVEVVSSSANVPPVEVPPADVPPADVPVPIETPLQTPEVPAAPSEVSSDADIGKLIPNDEAQAEPNAEQYKVGPDSVRTLSVEPGLRPILPADRPAWVGSAPDYTSAQHHLYVGSLPTSDESDADEALDAPLIAAVRNYIDQEVVNEHSASSRMPIDAEFIRRNLIDDPSGYMCELSTGQGPMFQKWVTVRVTPEQREQFAQWHTEATQRKRLTPLGLGLVSALALVSLSHMVLRRHHGPKPLPFVNQHPTEPAVVVRRSRSWTAFTVLGFLFFLMIPAFFVFAIFAFTARTHHNSPAQATIYESHRDSGLPYEVEMPDLHKEVRIETLEGGHKTVIIENTSRR